ncbi:hypothetical protein J5Y09_22470 [Roseomonas sp. PWR1]|uniref:Uncharacterized protein n=1 Tax=Roseomonas nitratireducens TaxID=2820810 RepID=A0ABS4AZD0_9PROT|nr:hypothetical protein [Neoroseomonas nitratireducens]MBP0466710.1 hypothetical protein [Neoroseomonas nitratireducens]
MLPDRLLVCPPDDTVFKVLCALSEPEPMLSTKLDDLKTAIKTKPERHVVSEFILDRVPHVFQDNRAQFRIWREQLSELIEVDSRNICIIGSGCVGYSLSPNKNFSEFSKDSDIDVAIISDFYFHLAWRSLRSVRASDARTPADAQALKSQKQLYLFYGCIAADRVLPFLSFRRDWTIAMAKMSGVKPTEAREVKFRLYRDYDSLRDYQAEGVLKLKHQLLEA